MDAMQAGAAPSMPAEVRELTEIATAGQGGPALAPWSAAHPYVNLYTAKNPITATVTGNYRLTAEDASSDIHHIVLDFGATPFPVLEGQSIGIIPPGVDVNAARICCACTRWRARATASGHATTTSPSR